MKNDCKPSSLPRPKYDLQFIVSLFGLYSDRVILTLLLTWATYPLMLLKEDQQISNYQQNKIRTYNDQTTDGANFLCKVGIRRASIGEDGRRYRQN